jgi:hypothetical protein
MTGPFQILISPPNFRPLVGAVALCVFFSAGCKTQQNTDKAKGPVEKQWNASEAKNEYQLMQAELKLAATEKVYLEIRFDLKKLRLKLKDAVVWDFPLDITGSESDDIQQFVDEFRKGGSALVRPLGETYLFAAQEKTPDSVLAIVSEVTKFRPELLQRELPERFQLRWGDNVILDVHTDVKGKPISKLKNTMLEVRHVLQSTIGEAHLSVKMDQVHAMTLFRVAQPGLATIVYPPA